MKLESTAHQPKMLRRIQMRYALGLFAVAALLFAWYALKDFVTDPGEGGHTDTSGWLVALKETPEGHQVAVIKPDGTVLDCPGYTNGASNQDPTFNHDGERIFFVSDRGSGKSLQVYRWNPARARVDQRSSGKLACEHPTFLEDGAPVGAETMLLAKAGVVVESNPKDGTAHQLVPPVGKSPTQAGGEDKEGMGAQFGPEYQHLGASFREAHWCKQGKYIAGVMRGDEGETLVIICVRDQKPDSKTVEDGMPHGIAKGEHIDMAIDPASGKIVYSVNNFQFIDPEAIMKNPDTSKNLIQGGKLVKPYRNLLAILDPDDPKSSGPIARWKIGDTPAGKPDVAFAQPTVSPDGKEVAFILGMDTPNGFQSGLLMVAPLNTGAAASARRLVGGNVNSPCWSPDGKLIGFAVMTPGGKSEIDTVPESGGDIKRVTTDGNFFGPRFSPMLPKPQ